MVKRFTGHKKEKPQKSYDTSLSPIRVKEDQIGKKYVSVIKNDENAQLVFDAKVGEEVVLLRYQYGTPGEWHPCIVKEIEEDGTVKLWDETLEQWFFFNWRAENLPAILRKNV